MLLDPITAARKATKPVPLVLGHMPLAMSGPNTTTEVPVLFSSRSNATVGTVNNFRLRQPVIEPLGALKLAVGPGAFALPRTAPLNAGVFAGPPGNFIGTAVAVR